MDVLYTTRAWKSDIVNLILERAGISKEHPDYGLEYNLCLAAFTSLGIRSGSAPVVKELLREIDIKNHVLYNL